MLWCEFLASKLRLIRWTETNSVWLHDCVVTVFATDWKAARLCSGSDEASASSANREEPQWPHWPGECYLGFLSKYTHATYKWEIRWFKKGETVLLFLWTLKCHYCESRNFFFFFLIKPCFSEITGPACMHTGVIWGLPFITYHECYSLYISGFIQVMESCCRYE